MVSAFVDNIPAYQNSSNVLGCYQSLFFFYVLIYDTGNWNNQQSRSLVRADIQQNYAEVNGFQAVAN